ncbi:MAG: hypothetical protein O6948_09590 [Deltaproteobacteria bacterium]|jgi:hypothetical protein|nr:hypothetical protein [Deltaproteobacteria bacterium]
MYAVVEEGCTMVFHYAGILAESEEGQATTIISTDCTMHPMIDMGR